MTTEVRAIRESEREECLDLWCSVWPGDNSQRYFRKYFYGDVDWLPYYTRVAVEDGRLVSAVHICKRTVACGEYRLTMGGIANVATLPEYRGKGYNTECLKQAISVMEADAMDFSLLFTGIHGYYRRLGYVEFRHQRLEGQIPVGFAPRASAYTVRPATEADMRAVQAVYAGYNRYRPIAVQRSEAYWREWITVNALFVAEDSQGDIRGYVHCGTFNSAIPYAPEDADVRVMEFGADSGDESDQEEVASALFDYLAAHFLALGANGLKLDLPFDAPVLRALEGVLELPKWRTAGAGMVRLLHRENLLRSLTPEMNDRWTQKGRPAGTLAFATPYGAVSLDGAGPFLRVTAVEEAAEARSQVALFEYLFNGLPSEESAPPFLAALFPERPEKLVYWGADGF